MRKILSITLLTLSLIICGCKDVETNISTITDNSRTNTTNVTKIALICSLTKVDKNAYDGWDGDCPGTDVDANIFAKLCADNGIPYIKLENSQCTAQNVVDKWYDCLSKLDPKGLFIFFYSGHGGQVYSETENDGLDETLCFWDGQFIDDNVWFLLNKVPKTARIFMVTDCCNSGTNYRLPYNLGNSKKKARGIAEPNLLHYGGCNDSESSYGSNRGGVFTAALKACYDKNISYYEWFNKSKNKMSGSQQKPTFAETGKSFKTTKIFQ